MKKTNWIPVTLGTLLIAGCGSNPETASQSEPKTEIASAPTTAPTRPGTSSLQLPSDAKEVVRLFLDSMRQGNGAQLSALLSTAAREEIKRKNMEIDPLGSPKATFQIGEVEAQGDGMLVSTTWTEPEQDGQPATELEVVWELRKEPVGWRICGMAVDPHTGEEIQVVNFERMEPEPAAQPRMASLPNAPTNAPSAGLPTGAAVPTTPNGAAPSFQAPPANAPNSMPANGGAGFGAPNPGQMQLPPSSQAPAQLPPIQPGAYQPAPNMNYQPVPQPQAPAGGFQLPPPSGNTGNYGPR
jgi:hypothetical protein